MPNQKNIFRKVLAVAIIIGTLSTSISAFASGVDKSPNPPPVSNKTKATTTSEKPTNVVKDDKTKGTNSNPSSTTRRTKNTGASYVDSSDKGKEIILVLLAPVGTEEQLHAIKKPGDTFSSSDPSMLSVTAGGKFKVLKEGTSYIVVKNGAKTTYIKIMTKPYKISLDQATYQTDSSKKPHLKSDGSIDYSYYVYDMTKTTIENYNPPQEIRYNPNKPVKGQLVRDTDGNLLMYMNPDFAEIITTEEEQRRERENISYETAGTKYRETGYAYMFNQNLGTLYMGGTPQNGQYKLENGKLLHYPSSMWAGCQLVWSLVLGQIYLGTGPKASYL